MIDYFYLATYKLFSFLVKKSPQKILDYIICFLASFAYIASKKRRKVINANLNICFPDLNKNEKKSIAKRSYKNLLYNISGFIKRQNQSKQEVLQNITFENQTILEKIIKKDEKFIFMTAHFGVWEVLPTAVALKFDLPISVVGRELDSKLMQKYLKKNREQFNVELINKKGALKGMIKAINRGRVIGLLIDQSIPASQSVDVQLFNKKVTQTPALSLMSRKFNATIIPVFVTSKDHKNHTVTFYEPIKPIKTDDMDADIQKLSQIQADVLQSVIKKRPDEWFWSHKRFKVYDGEIYK